MAINSPRCSCLGRRFLFSGCRETTALPASFVYGVDLVVRVSGQAGQAGQAGASCWVGRPVPSDAKVAGPDQKGKVGA